jgi:hypothetical protein
VTYLVCPVHLAMILPVSMSHNFTAPSARPQTTFFPSRDNAIANTPFFPSRQASPICSPVFKFHTRSEPSEEQVIIRCPHCRCITPLTQSVWPSNFWQGLIASVFCVPLAAAEKDMLIPRLQLATAALSTGVCYLSMPPLTKCMDLDPKIRFERRSKPELRALWGGSRGKCEFEVSAWYIMYTCCILVCRAVSFTQIRIWRLFVLTDRQKLASNSTFTCMRYRVESINSCSWIVICFYGQPVSWSTFTCKEVLTGKLSLEGA